MTSLAEQMIDLQRQETIIKRKKNRLKLEIEFQNNTVQDLEQEALKHVKEISKLFTHLRDTYGKRYQIHSGFHMTSTVELRIIEPRGNPNGYDRYLEYNEDGHEDVNTVLDSE